MDVDALLREVRGDPGYADQIVYVHDLPARAARYAQAEPDLSPGTRAMFADRGIERLYTHQADAIASLLDGQDILLTTGTASGKSLCYQAPLLEMLRSDPAGRALLLFPTKALSQDQYRQFRAALSAAGLGDVSAGVFDGDTPAETRRTLRARGRVIFTNPDMLHAGILPQHARWAEFFRHCRLVVLDELHVYNGIFGANVANLMRRCDRIWAHYGSRPTICACSATVGNPDELGRRVTGRDLRVLDDDASPRGRRVYVLWNPPRERQRLWRSRRSANVEAHELMAELIRRGAATIAFSKAKMTAEMIHRYVAENLRETAPHLAGKVTPYRGGYRPEDRREIERRLFDGELMGVSATRALELGIDVGGLDAAIIVGYPGELASFFQQAGRAGRRDRDALIVLVGLDTAVNQYILTHPEYLFGRPIERAVVDADNPFVVLGHLRCGAHEKPLERVETPTFGPHADMALGVLEENHKLKHIDGRWYHAATEVPQHETPLRDTVDANVLIEDVATGEVLGEVNLFDAPPILHPEAIYMHRGDTYRVLKLDLDRNIATVRREDVDYYTQPIGGTDIHHIDARLREKPFGLGTACWGEVTAYFRCVMFEKVRFYELDAISRHPLDLPTFSLDTMAFWIVPPEELCMQVRAAGLDVHAGLRGIGYATRMLLPLFITCQTLDFSHSIGSVNSPWNAIFVYERYPLGVGFTEAAYHRLDEIMPAVLDAIRRCPCAEGCPCCVGKPLRGYTTWNPERGEGSIPSKPGAIMILEEMLSGGSLRTDDTLAVARSDAAEQARLEQAVRRRLERLREPKLFHAIEPKIETRYPTPEPDAKLDAPDVATRKQRRTDYHKGLRKRLAKKLGHDGLDPFTARGGAPVGMSTGKGNLPPRTFPGRPAGTPIDEGAMVSGAADGHDPTAAEDGACKHAPYEEPPAKPAVGVPTAGAPTDGTPVDTTPPDDVTSSEASASERSRDVSEPPHPTIYLGDDLAARARQRFRKRKKGDT